MGRHAAPRTTGGGRRTVTISAGTLALCICGFAPALAATDPPPVPKPVSDAVQQVSNMTGLPNPLPPSEGAARHQRRPAHHSTGQGGATPPTRHVATGSSTAGASALPAPFRTTPLTVRPAALRSTATPALSGPSQADPASLLKPLAALPVHNDTARILLVAIATLLLGALASGHIKAAQDFVFAR